jgi:hypothetical protein
MKKRKRIMMECLYRLANQIAVRDIDRETTLQLEMINATDYVRN